jgi:hypothetical protein
MGRSGEELIPQLNFSLTIQKLEWVRTLVGWIQTNFTVIPLQERTDWFTVRSNSKRWISSSSIAFYASYPLFYNEGATILLSVLSQLYSQGILSWRSDKLRIPNQKLAKTKHNLKKMQR